VVRGKFEILKSRVINLTLCIAVDILLLLFYLSKRESPWTPISLLRAIFILKIFMLVYFVIIPGVEIFLPPPPSGCAA
jgi:hypothetical protein